MLTKKNTVQEKTDQSAETKPGLKVIKSKQKNINTQRKLTNKMGKMTEMEKPNNESSDRVKKTTEPPDPKKEKSRNKNQKSTSNHVTSTISLLLFMITIISGAQIGTSQSEISIMQIESIIVKRSTWLTEKMKIKRKQSK